MAENPPTPPGYSEFSPKCYHIPAKLLQAEIHNYRPRKHILIRRFAGWLVVAVDRQKAIKIDLAQAVVIGRGRESSVREERK